LKHWYIFDVGVPVVASLTVLGIARWFMPENYSFVESVVAILAVALIAFWLAVLVARDIRSWMIGSFTTYLKKLQSL
jgi:hypothetical protein